MKEKILASVLMLGITMLILSFRPPVEKLFTEDVQVETETFFVSKLDTVPERQHPITKKHSKVIELRNGEIQRLEIDGEEIPPEEYEKYELIIEEEIVGDDIIIELAPHQEIEVNDFFIHMDTLPEWSKEYEIVLKERLHEMEGMAAHLNDKFILMYDSLEPNLYRFNFDSIMPNFEFNTQQLQEQMLWSEKALKESIGKAKEQYHLFQEQNEWLNQEELEDRIRLFQDEYFDKEAWKEYNRELKEQLKEFKEVEGFQFKHKSPSLEKDRWPSDGDYEFFYEFPNHNEFRFGNFEKQIFHELNQDGLIQEGLNTMVITGKYMKLNGKKVNDRVFQKYRSMYEKQLGGEMDKNSKIKIKRYFNKDKIKSTI
jgi:hypothetical protein